MWEPRLLPARSNPEYGPSGRWRTTISKAHIRARSRDLTGSDLLRRWPPALPCGRAVRGVAMVPIRGFTQGVKPVTSDAIAIGTKILKKEKGAARLPPSIWIVCGTSPIQCIAVLGKRAALSIAAPPSKSHTSSVITLNPAIRDRVKSGHREWQKT